MKPKRELDPYEMNEVKGTRMPDYSGVTKDRDIYGELGWIQILMLNVQKIMNRDMLQIENILMAQ